MQGIFRLKRNKVEQTFGAAGKLSLLEVSDFQVFCSRVSPLTSDHSQKQEKAAHERISVIANRETPTK